MSTSSNIKNPLSVVKPESNDELDATTAEALPDSVDETDAISETVTANDVRDETSKAATKTTATAKTAAAAKAPTTAKTAATATTNDAGPETVTANDAEQEIEDGIDLDSPELYLNRELTWLEFNRRVLHEAIDDSNPLLERLKFVGIVSSNLDEFFMKSIGGLKQQVGAGILDYSVDGRLPARQIEECYVKVRELEALKDDLIPVLVDLLAQEDIHIT